MAEAALAFLAGLAGLALGLWLGERRVSKKAAEMSDMAIEVARQFGATFRRPEPYVHDPKDTDEEVAHRAMIDTEIDRLAEHIEAQGHGPDAARKEATRLVAEFHGGMQT